MRGNKQGAGQTSARLHSSAGPCSSPEAPQTPTPEHRLEIREPCGSRRGLTLKVFFFFFFGLRHIPAPLFKAGPADTGYAALEELGLDNWYCQFVSLPCSLPRVARTDLLTSPSSSQQSMCVCVCVCVCVCMCWRAGGWKGPACSE